MENERDNKPVPAQWLHLLNSSHIQRKLEQGPKLKAIFELGRKPTEILEDLYLTVLSRFPTAEEVQTAERYSGFAPVSRPAPVGRPDATGKPDAVRQPAPVSQPRVAAKPRFVAKPEAVKRPVYLGRTGTAAKPGGAGAARKPVLTNRPADWVDITWALINSDEFLYRH
jgi:hypothetical protein